MKRMIYFLAACCAAMVLQAQTVDYNGLATFIKELKALKGEHVECESEMFDHYATENSKVTTANLVFPSDLVSLGMRNEIMTLGGISKSDTTFHFVHLMSEDEIGYNLVMGVVGKYYNDLECEAIFGIPLMACQREDGEEQTLFLDENNTLLIRDSGDEIEILYGSFNIVNTVQNALRSVVDVTDEDYVDVEMFGGVDFSVRVTDKKNFEKSPNSMGAAPEDIMRFVHKIKDENLAFVEGRVANAASDAERDECVAAAEELKTELEEFIDGLAKKLDELEVPKFVEVMPASDEYFVAIPKVSKEQKEKMMPYAASGVYDWINNSGFCKGAKMGNIDQISCIITPRDVAKQYVIRNFPREKWYDDGFTTEYKEVAVREYQGGTPAVLYRFSQNELGYNDMLRDLGYLFGLQPGAKHWGLEVTQQVENGGKRFVQLWGEGGVVVSLFDSPQDKYSHFSVVIGGVDGFEKAVDEYLFGGERDFSKKCNIVIDSDLGNNSYGIHFIAEDYLFAGKSHKNGVHIDFGYAKRFKGL